jgi:hypothetical protein
MRLHPETYPIGGIDSLLVRLLTAAVNPPETARFAAGICPETIIRR